MSLKKNQIVDIIKDVAEILCDFNKCDEWDMLKLDAKAQKVKHRIERLSHRYKERLVLVEACLEQYRGLILSSHCNYLHSQNAEYGQIRNYIEMTLNFMQASKNKIDDFEQTVDYLDYIHVDEKNVLFIDFGDFEIEMMDFWLICYNFYQNAGSILMSLSAIPSDIYMERYENLELAVDYLRNALQITRDFMGMIRSRREQKNSWTQKNDENGSKIDKNAHRIPKSFFNEMGTIDVMDNSISDDRGFVQYLIDLRMKCFFEIGKAYCALNKISEASNIYSEAIDTLTNRENHGKKVEKLPPHSWHQLIKYAVRFGLKHHKEMDIIGRVIAFYIKNEVNVNDTINILQEKCVIDIHNGDHCEAIRTIDKIKEITCHRKEVFVYETISSVLQKAEDSRYIITLIQHKLNNLRDEAQYIYNKEHDNCFELMKEINVKIMHKIYYGDDWSIEHENPNCPPPVDMVEEAIECVLSHIDIDVELKNINLIECIQRLNGKSDDEKNQDMNDEDLWKVATSKMKKQNAQILIDFLHFGAMWYVYQQPTRNRSAVKLLSKIEQLAKVTKCKMRHAAILIKLAKCEKNMKNLGKALEHFTKSAKIAQKIGHIQFVRDARLGQVEIFDLQKNKSSKEAIVETYLERKYNLRAAQKYVNEHGDGYKIKCKYEQKRSMNINIVTPLNDDNNDIESDDSDDIEVLSNCNTQRPKAKMPQKKSKFEEDSSDESDADTIKSFAERKKQSTSSNTIQRKRKKNLNEITYPMKRRKFNNNPIEIERDNLSDTETTITSIGELNDHITDLCSDSDDDEKEFDAVLDSQMSESIDELDEDAAENYYKGDFNQSINGSKKNLKLLTTQQISSNDQNRILMKKVKLKIEIAETYFDKATYIKDNEPSNIETHKMVRACQREARQFAYEVYEDTQNFRQRDLQKCKHDDSTQKFIKKTDSMIMFHFFASLDMNGKYLMATREWDEAITKYEKYLKYLIDHKTVHPIIVLHWKYYIVSHLAYSLRQRAEDLNGERSNSETYSDQNESIEKYKLALAILEKLSKQRKSFKNYPSIASKFKYVSETPLMQSQIAVIGQMAYTNIELAHAYVDLRRWQSAIACYEKAADVACKHHEMKHFEFDALWHLALTFEDMKDYKQALSILQKDCRELAKRMAEAFEETSFRIQQFEIERRITKIFLQQKQTTRAVQPAQRMLDIATRYLSAHKKYLNEANRYIQEVQMKTKYKLDIALFEKKANQSKTGRGRNKNTFQALRRYFNTNSYGTIAEMKNQYIGLIPHMGDQTALHILFYLGFSFKMEGKYQHARHYFMEALNNTRARSSVLSKIAWNCFEVMDNLNVCANDRLKILLRGKKYLNFDNIKDIDYNYDYLQKILIFYRMYCGHSNAMISTIKQIENDLACLERRHPNNRFKRKNNFRGQQAKYRRNQRKHSRRNERYFKKHRNQFFRDNDDHQQKRTGSAFISRSTRDNHRQRMRHYYQTEVAQSYAGLTANSPSSVIEGAINGINKELKDNPTRSVHMELMNIKNEYVNFLSIAKQREQHKKQQTTNNIHQIADQAPIIKKISRGNIVGIIDEKYHWEYKAYSNNMYSKWTKFSVTDSNKIENAYLNEDEDIDINNYCLRFRMLGNYKFMSNSNEKYYVRRRVEMKSLSPKRISNWTSVWSNAQRQNHSNNKKMRRMVDKVRNKTEFDAICALMKNRGMSIGLHIHRIERLENMTNSSRYNMCHGGNDNQLLLFHGTSQSNAENIIREGTDFRLHGDNGVKYGNGSYFAVYSSYAANFCRPAADKSLEKMVRYMFLCAVKAGQYCQGQNGMRRPPNNPNEKGLYDSVVDDVQCPSMFVTFDNAQSLPLYLITFSFDNHH